MFPDDLNFRKFVIFLPVKSMYIARDLGTHLATAIPGVEQNIPKLALKYIYEKNRIE